MILLLDANGALVLAAVGVLLICGEFCLPGWVIPGVAGGVCLVCGVYRLALLDACGFAAAGLSLTLAAAGAAGYGWIPRWLGLLAIAAAPVAARFLLPAGGVHWAAALSTALPAGAAMALLRVAGRAVANKTLLQ